MADKKEEGFEGLMKGLKEQIAENLSQPQADLDKLDDERYERDRRAKPSKLIEEGGKDKEPAKPGEEPLKPPKIS